MILVLDGHDSGGSRGSRRNGQGCTQRKSTREGFGEFKDYLKDIFGNPSLAKFQRKKKKTLFLVFVDLRI